MLELEPGMEEMVSRQEINDFDNPVSVLPGNDDIMCPAVTPGIERRPGSILISLSGLAPNDRCEVLVYDMAGKIVEKLSSRINRAHNTVTWETGAFPAGMYVIRLRVFRCIIYEKS